MTRSGTLGALGATCCVLTLAACGSKHGTTPSTTTRGTTTTTTTTTAQSAASQAAAASASDAALIALRPFSASSPWNTPIETSPLDPNSARYLALVRQRIGTVELGGRQVRQQVTTESGSLYVNTTRWAPPIVDVNGGRSTRFVCRQLPGNCGDEVSTLDVPPNVSPLPQFDGWFTVTDRNRGVAYDFWRARRSTDGGTISYQFARRWNLNGPGFLRPTVVSARGAGLPLFAGVIVPQEIRAGRIDHALAISLPGPARRNYVQPASRTDGQGAPNSLPEGARIRLRAGFRLRRVPNGTNPRAAEAIVAALKRYGAIVVGRARVPTLYAQQNFRWSDPADGSTPSLATTGLDAASAAPNVVTTTITGTTAGGTTTTDTTAGAATVAPDVSSPTGLSVSAQTVNSPAALAVSRNARRPIPLLQGNELQGLTVSEFEVVQLPAMLQDPPLDIIQVSNAVGNP